MAKLKLVRCTNNQTVQIISLEYNESTLEAQKIIWYRSDTNNSCLAILLLSEEYNLVAEDFDVIDANNYEFILPTGLFMEFDETEDLDISVVTDYLRNR